MKLIFTIAVLLSAVPGLSQQAASAAPSTGAGLEAVLTQMDKAAQSFKSAQADFVQDLYMEVTQETETQNGQIYFRRSGRDMDVSVNIAGPGARQIVFKDGKARMYQPKIDQVTEYESGKNKADIEAFVSLGFGGRGHDLLKSYDVKLAGWETIDSVRTARLELVPNSRKVRGMFSRIVLWVDPQHDVLLKQQLFEPSGDYRTAHYKNIKVNARLDDDVFRIRTTSHTKVVRPE